MKKRILALALAGTTAFSVFGAALSANAAESFLSTDNQLKVDAYQSYVPVADTIAVTYNATSSSETVYYYKNGNSYSKVNGDLDDFLASRTDVKNNYTEMILAKKDTNINYYVTANGKKIIGVTNGTPGDIVNTKDYLTSLGISYDESSKQYIVTVDGNPKSFGELKDAVDAIRPKDAATRYFLTEGTKGSTVLKPEAYNELEYQTQEEYAAANIIEKVESTDNANAVNNVQVNGDKDGVWTKWSFNSDMSGETAVEPYEVTTKVVTEVINGKPVSYLDVTKKKNPTVYAYDFLYNNYGIKNTASSIASAWSDKDAEKTAELLGGTTTAGAYRAEEGRGVAGRGIRYDVVSEWESFMYELSIQEGGYYYSIDNYDDFESLYVDRFYADPVFDANSGILVGYEKVDLYNIKGLLKDIWELRTATAKGDSTGYYNANTSELIYLMQQYDKYIGDYIDDSEVSTDEWGDLLVNLLNSVSAEDFKNALDYKKYTATVEKLTAEYENALTAAQVIAAENAMYDLLTDANAPYYSAGADKTALTATMEGLYFNVGTAPVQYSVNASTPSNNVDYTNYNYLVATPKFEGNVFTGFTTTLTKGYYSLYPMDDYLDYTGATNAVYAGNESEKTYASAQATDEYEWFWNVYQLAANMNKYNKYQGSVDAVNEALNTAVAELSVTTTPAGVDTGALADSVAKYEGKIDTDYNEGYYAKYTQANEYAEVAEGKWQTRIAAMITGVAGEALTYQGTQVTVTKNDMKTVETAIKNGETALKAIKEDANYNAAQVTALNKAIDQAKYLVSLYEGTYSKNGTYQSVNKVPTTLVGDKDQMVKSDLTAAIEAIDSAINYSEIVMGWSKNDAGKWQYGTEEGYLSNGWNKIGKTWFYFNADGTAKQSEWFQENGTWYWFNSNCGAATGWAKVDGEWYFFKGNNAMKTGWEKVDGNWYYMASSGKMVTGWCEVNGKWYYFSKASNSLGQMLYSTTVDGYKLGADGAWIK